MSILTKTFCIAFLLSFFSLRTTASEKGFPGTEILLPGQSHESILELRYEESCRGLSPGIVGAVSTDSGVLRVDLFERGRAALFVPAGKNILRLDPNPDCSLRNFRWVLRPLPEGNSPEAEAFRHSPVIVVREDQAGNRLTDLPILLAYSVHTGKDGSRTLRYTVFFSDEDSLKSVRDTDGQMARYGRRADIEWVYEVSFGSDGKVLRRRYQGGIIGGLGHLSREFRGRYLPGSEHPVLYDIADHNVFADSPAGRRKEAPSYRLLPEERLVEPEAREAVLFRNPWAFAVSDREMLRERKAGHASEEYLFVSVQGRLSFGAFRVRAEWTDGTGIESGGGKGSVDRLGESLWGKTSYTALPFGSARLDAVGRGLGALHFVKAHWWGFRLKIESLRFFRLVTKNGRPEFRELTPFFRCDYEKMSCCF